MKARAFHREALEEFDEAAIAYAAINPLLGHRFYKVIDALIADACTMPQTFRMIHPPVRRHFRRDFLSVFSMSSVPMTFGFSP